MASGLQGTSQGLFNFNTPFLPGRTSPFGIDSARGNSFFNRTIFRTQSESGENTPSSSDGQLSPSNSNPSLDVNSPFSPITVRLTLGGRSLEALSKQQQSGPRGGTSGFVSGGPLALETGNDETLKTEAGDQLTVLEQDDGSIRISNDDRDVAITVQSGNKLRTSGEGRLTLLGGEGLLSIKGSGTLRFERDNGETRAVDSSSSPVIELGKSGNTLEVQSRRASQNDTLTLLSNRGSSITFEQGESGTVRLNEDGSLAIINEDRSRSVTVRSNATISVLGEASGVLSSERTGGSLELFKGDNLQLSPTAEDGITVRNETERSQVAVSSGREPDQPAGPLRFQFLEETGFSSLRALTRNLAESVLTNRENLDRTLEATRVAGSSDRDDATAGTSSGTVAQSGRPRTSTAVENRSFNVASDNLLQTDEGPGITGLEQRQFFRTRENQTGPDQGLLDPNRLQNRFRSGSEPESTARFDAFA